MYVLPCFVDLHAHTGGEGKAPQPEYVYKLWMGHGVTTSRGVGHTSFERSLEEKALAAENEIVAPRMFTYVRPGSGEGWDGGSIQDPETAREWVRWAASQEVEGQRIDGLKLGAYDPQIMEALIDEAHGRGLGTVAHLDQMGLPRMTALDAARLGLDMMTHHYGLFESMLDQASIQNWPVCSKCRIFFPSTCGNWIGESKRSRRESMTSRCFERFLESAQWSVSHCTRRSATSIALTAPNRSSLTWALIQWSNKVETQSSTWESVTRDRGGFEAS
jgi:hypothetical protein